MTNDVTEYQGGAVTAAPEWVSKIELVKRLVAKGCSNDEFELLCYVAQKHDLDPLAGDVWMIPFQGGACKPTGQLDGIEKGTETVDGELFHWATIWRKDCSHPFTARIRAKEYDQSRNPLWKGKPWTMGEKVAASHALRLAFTLDGLYIPEEMPEPEPVRNEPREVPDTSTPVKVQPKAIKVNIEPMEPVSRCDVCGKGSDEFPAIRITQKDGKSVCGSCLRAEKAREETPASIPTAPPKAPEPKEIGAGFVCAECGKQVTNSEEKASRLMLNKTLCRACMQAWTAPEDDGAKV
jgi:hypothetical protein